MAAEKQFLIQCRIQGGYSLGWELYGAAVARRVQEPSGGTAWEGD